MSITSICMDSSKTDSEFDSTISNHTVIYQHTPTHHRNVTHQHISLWAFGSVCQVLIVRGINHSHHIIACDTCPTSCTMKYDHLYYGIRILKTMKYVPRNIFPGRLYITWDVTKCFTYWTVSLYLILFLVHPNALDFIRCVPHVGPDMLTRSTWSHVLILR